MGVNLRDLLSFKPVDLKELSGRVIAIDAMNTLYQFLSIIRQPDGASLMDRRGNITSHLSGIFYRTINLLEAGIKPVYVFDGEPPELKSITVEERKKIRDEAAKKWEEALEKGDLEEARKFAQSSTKLTDEMVEESKRLLEAMGVPHVQAPSEGEAQAAYMAYRGDAWAVASQDYDCLLFNSPYLVRNLTISGRRKLPKKEVYVKVEPELVSLKENLDKLGITREQLIGIGILLGTDYNEGVKGIGVKTAFKLIKEKGSIEKVLEEEKIEIEPPVAEIKQLFLKPKTTDHYQIRWAPINKNQVYSILCDEHDFSRDRVQKAMERIQEEKGKAQSRLEQFFKS
ncbi:MAG: flap endonuclease-1 [Candidatus Jordarchaeaceae archaeon]